MNKIRVTIWNEYLHEKDDPEIAKIYPEGIHGAIKRGIEDDPELEIRLATLRDPEQGLPDDVLNNTDVLLWWAHIAHSEVEDALVEKIVNRVRRNGMGFIALHSAHASKPFGQLVGTTGSLSWGDNYHEFMWTLLPQHPVAKGIGPYIDIESEEVYSEPFCIGNPDEIVFGSWFESGNILRSGCCFYRGLGKVFYFQPGHETCRSYYHPEILKVIKNAIHWAAPTNGFEDPGMPMISADATPAALHIKK